MSSTTRLPRVVCAGVALLALHACTGNAGGTGPEPTPPREHDPAPTVTPGPLPDQSPPKSTFGVAFHNDLLWVADLHGGQVLAVDPDSGAVMRRLRKIDGVSDEVINVAVGPDGTVYWIGYQDGALAFMSPSNQYLTFNNVAAHTVGIGLSADGKTVFAAGSIAESNGIWVSTPDANQIRRVKRDGTDVKVRIRSFTVGRDGFLYGARFGPETGPTRGNDGALIKVDPVTGTTQEVVGGLHAPIAVALSQDQRTAYVLSLLPGEKPSLVAVNLDTKAVQTLPAPRTALVENLTVAPDGRIFVTARNEPRVNVINTDGTVGVLELGQPERRTPPGTTPTGTAGGFSTGPSTTRATGT